MDHSTAPIDPPDESNDSKRTRSPAYPAIGLREAVDIAKTILDLAGHRLDEVSSDAISERLGLKENGSVFRVKMSALKKFDLVDEIQTDQWRLTSGALIIFDETTPELDRAKTLNRVALHPTIYEDLYNRFKNKPSRPSVKVYLHQQKFNPKVFETVINDFVDSMLFAGLFTAEFASRFERKQISTNVPVSEEFYSLMTELSRKMSESVQVDTSQLAMSEILTRLNETNFKQPDLSPLTKTSEQLNNAYAEIAAKFWKAHNLSNIFSDSLSTTPAALPEPKTATPLPPTALPSATTVIPATPSSAPAQTSVISDTLQIPVGEGRHATIPYPMDEASYDILMETLRLWKPKIVNTKPDEKKNA